MPTGFEYEEIEGGVPDVPANDRLRHYMALYGGQTHCGSEVLDTSTGLQAFTGCGFQPEALIISGVALSTTRPDGVSDNGGILHLGAAAGSNQWGGSVFAEHLGFSGKSSAWSDNRILYVTIGGIDIEAELDSFDSDGFTLNVINAPGVEVQFFYLAMRGGGGYACGTAQARTGTLGLQSITGLGFQPEAVFFAGTYQSALGNTNSFARMFMGGADALTNSYLVWAGSTVGDPYHDQIARGPTSSDPVGVPVCVSFIHDAEGSGVPAFHPTTQSEARLESLDADGFTLNWTTVDATARYYSWFAVENGEVGRWIYNDALINFVETREGPRGLIFFNNDRGGIWKDTFLLGHNPPTGSYGASLGFGVCDEDLNQCRGSYVDVSEPPFGVAETARHHFCEEAFGSFPQSIGSLPSNFGNARGRIILLEGFLPIVGMNWRYAERHMAATRGLVNQDGLGS